jgi:hypothetical protein
MQRAKGNNLLKVLCLVGVWVVVIDHLIGILLEHSISRPPLLPKKVSFGSFENEKSDYIKKKQRVSPFSHPSLFLFAYLFSKFVHFTLAIPRV